MSFPVRCGRCGQSYYVGQGSPDHICRKPAAPVTKPVTPAVIHVANAAPLANSMDNTVVSQPADAVSQTYRHRDPEKRRAYMRALMRKRRAAG